MVFFNWLMWLWFGQPLPGGDRRRCFCYSIRANESMALARENKQRFASLEDSSNHGTEYGSTTYWLTQAPNDNHRIHVIKRMDAYRNSS